jgi:regulator of protease activity HflC (stomatin/prohibitin superfamily)
MMAKQSKTLLVLVVALVVSGGLWLSRQREVVGVDQIGVVVSPGGRIAVYQPGDRPLVLPMLQHYVRLTAKPVRYELTDAKAITITGVNHQAITIGCQVRYQVEDAAKLVAAQGPEAPQVAVEGIIHQHLSAQLTAALQKENASLDDVQTRVVLVGGVHQTLKEVLDPLGIRVLAFDLFSR